MKDKFNKTVRHELTHKETGETFALKLTTKQACRTLAQMDFKSWDLKQK